MCWHGGGNRVPGGWAVGVHASSTTLKASASLAQVAKCPGLKDRQPAARTGSCLILPWATIDSASLGVTEKTALKLGNFPDLGASDSVCLADENVCTVASQPHLECWPSRMCNAQARLLP